MTVFAEKTQLGLNGSHSAQIASHTSGCDVPSFHCPQHSFRNSAFVLTGIALNQGTIAFGLQTQPHVAHLCLFASARSKYQMIEQSGRRRPSSKITCLTSDGWLGRGGWCGAKDRKCASREKQQFHNWRLTENSMRYDVEKSFFFNVVVVFSHALKMAITLGVSQQPQVGLYPKKLAARFYGWIS